MMKQKVVFWLLTFLILGIALPSSAQVCGDVSGDGFVTIGDMTRLLDWIVGNGPAPANPAMGDIDGYTGATLADIVRMSWYLFDINPGTYNCSPTQTYSYASSPDDTLFIPRFLGVPADQDVVYLPILTNLRADSKGLVFYTQYSTDGLFNITSIDALHGGLETYIPFHADTLAGCIIRMEQDKYIEGPLKPAMITFTRTNPGVGDIELFPVDRNSTWRLGVVKDNYDIQIPTIVIIDFNENQLQAAPTELSFESILYFPPPAVVQNIELTDVTAPIEWTAAVDQDWMNIDVDFGTTPSTIQVSVDPTELVTGIYNGTITITNISFPYATPIEIPVTLTVRAPFPSMDANCDGKFNISDLTYIIDYLFGIPQGPAPCDPCTGTFPTE